MIRCKNCGAYLDAGEICDCVKSREERAMMKEAMLTSLKYLDTLGEIAESDEEAGALNEAFKTVLTEIAEKYDVDPKEFMAKVIDVIEEFKDRWNDI